MTLDELWTAVLTEIEFNISKANFNTWFKDTNLISCEKNLAQIGVPNGFVKDWLENKYKKIILKILRKNDPSIKDITFRIQKEIKKREEKSVEELNQKLNFDYILIDQETGLNPKYTFESFIVGSFNEVAYAAANSIIKNLGLLYNPLFIYGGVGLGKTHLIQAIGNEIKKIYNTKSIKYITSEKFTNDFINALSNKNVDNFRAQFENINLLIIDDVQFFAGKEKIQEVFFNIFNDLYNKNKQIIISSDRPPHIIPTIEERLKSRFQGGMITDIGYPDFETRVAIIKKKLDIHKETLSEEIINYIAANVQKNIRELEGVLNKVLLYNKIQNNLTLDVVKKIFEKGSKKIKKMTTFSNIVKIVSEFFDLKEEELLTPSRKSEYVIARQFIMYLLRNELKLSYPAIGERLGGKDHTTVMYACKKIDEELNNNEEIKQIYNNLIQKLYLTNC